MIATLLFLTLSATPTQCGEVQIAQANADIKTALTMLDSPNVDARVTGSLLLIAAQESLATAIASCTPTPIGNVTPFASDDTSADPFDLDDSDGEAEMLYRAIVDQFNEDLP